jgi:SAM-dependent methyltransferase
MGTDKDWEKWGATDPYFGVISSEKFRKDSLDAGAKAEFFASGSEHVERVLRLIREHFDPAFQPRTALDFGCGVGRLVLPLAARTERTLGVDVSPSMLAEAAANASAAGVTNVAFALSDDALSNVADRYSLIHSYIVFQHIPWARGRTLIQQLADRVEAGGVLAIHLFTATSAPKLVRAVVRLRYALPPLNWMRNALKGRPLFEPPMQLNVYDLPTVLADLKARGFDTPVCIDEPAFEGFTGVFLLARRRA